MGGRGGSSGLTVSPAQERKLEDTAQKSDAKYAGLRLGAKYYEYTDRSGKITKGETGSTRQGGGTYKASYSDQVAAYAKMSTSDLQKERKSLYNYSTDNYQKFSRSAASKSASQVEAFAGADAKIRAIDQVLRRRKRS